jgi:hypothetical protein
VEQAATVTAIATKVDLSNVESAIFIKELKVTRHATMISPQWNPQHQLPRKITFLMEEAAVRSVSRMPIAKMVDLIHAENVVKYKGQKCTIFAISQMMKAGVFGVVCKCLHILYNND